VQLQCTVQSIVTVLTTSPGPNCLSETLLHSRSPDSLIQVIDKGRSRLLWLLCFFLFMLLVAVDIDDDPTRPREATKKLLASDAALYKAVKCHASNVCTTARYFSCNCSVRGSPAETILRAVIMPFGAPMALVSVSPKDRLICAYKSFQCFFLSSIETGFCPSLDRPSHRPCRLTRNPKIRVGQHRRGSGLSRCSRLSLATGMRSPFVNGYQAGTTVGIDIFQGLRHMSQTMEPAARLPR
jgi:hypothetical protein